MLQNSKDSASAPTSENEPIAVYCSTIASFLGDTAVSYTIHPQLYHIAPNLPIFPHGHFPLFSQIPNPLRKNPLAFNKRAQCGSAHNPPEKQN